jgi:hypothetical protein
MIVASSCLCLHGSRIQSFQPGSIEAGNPVGKQNLVQQKNQNRAVRTYMYCITSLQYVQVCTCLYCSLLFWYSLVPPCTALYSFVPEQYILVQTRTYCKRNYLCQYRLVRTSLFKKFNQTPFIPSHFNTRHLFSRNLIPCTLTLFAQNSATLLLLSSSILKKAGVGGCPVAKPLTCKFEAKTAQAPDGADGTCAAEEGRRRNEK